MIMHLKNLTERLGARLGAGMVAGLLLFGAPPAHAAITDLIEQLRTSSMPTAPRTLGSGRQRNVVLNGFPLHVISERTTAPLREVIDYYQSHFLKSAQAQKQDTPAFALRQLDPDRSFVIGIDPGDKERLSAMASGRQPLLEGAPLRLVYAQRSANQTDYLVAWSDRPIPEGVLSSPAQRDAAGADLPEIPRPDGIRIFSFTEPATGWSLATYQVATSPEVALHAAVSRLHAAGFTDDPDFAAVRELAAAEGSNMQPAAHLTMRGRDLLVSARPARQGRGSRLTYISKAQ